MKKILRSLFIIGLAFIMLVPNTSAAEPEALPEWRDIELTDEETAAILALNPTNTVINENSRATGLISAYSIAISKNDNDLYVIGKTVGNAQVVKCGFKKLIVERRKGSSYSWEEYRYYEDLYIDAAVYNLAKVMPVATGYQYRVTCIHYAKKNFLSVQKIENSSNILTIN